MLLLWRELTVELGGGDAAVDEDVGAGDEAAVGSLEEGGEGGDLVGGAGGSAGLRSIIRR